MSKMDFKNPTTKIFISKIDNSLGYHIVEQLRNDHLLLNGYRQISGTTDKDLDQQSLRIHSSIEKIYDFESNREATVRKAIQSDFVILDIRGTNIPKEIQTILKVLETRKAIDTKRQKKHPKVIGISNYMTWANTSTKKFATSDNQKEKLLDLVVDNQHWVNERLSCENNAWTNRIPHPSHIYHYELQNKILKLQSDDAAQKQVDEKSLDSYVLCCGLLYGEDGFELTEIIQKCVLGQQINLSTDGLNKIPFTHISTLVQSIQCIVHGDAQSKQTFQLYEILLQQKIVDLKRVVQAISQYIGVKPKIIQGHSIPINNNDIAFSVSLQLISNSNHKQGKKRLITEKAGKIISQFHKNFQIQTLRCFISYQVVANEQFKWIMDSLEQKYIHILNKGKLNQIVTKMLSDGSVQQLQQDQINKPTLNSMKKNSRNSSKKEPYQIFFKQAVQKYFQGKQISHVLVCLQSRYFNDVKQVLELKFSQNSRLIRFVSSQNESASQNQIIINSDQFFEVLKIQRPNPTVLQQKDADELQQPNGEIEVQNKGQQAANNCQDSKSILQIKQQKNRIFKEKKSKKLHTNNNRMEGEDVSILKQYLLDNLVIHLAEARQKLTVNSKRLSIKSGLKDLLTELKRISTRESRSDSL